ncbi:hypothetical protein LBMAG12_05450 [Actinomycetes bacterium]|nr:hypothetical protein LBMAG12_05450 [Actinomycetes bacterium]
MVVQSFTVGTDELVVSGDEFGGSLEHAVTINAITSAQSLIRVIANLRGSLLPYAYGTSHDDAE